MEIHGHANRVDARHTFSIYKHIFYIAFLALIKLIADSAFR
jgi:hypothetical protein